MSILEQIIEVYQFIKERGLIHGNIKPTNILVNDDDQITIKLTDFFLSSNNEKEILSSEFMAPEIISKRINPNIISDIFSIGEIMKLLVKSANLPTDTYDKLIQDCLEIDPSKRIQFDILRSHPCFTSVSPVYKYFRDNLYICTCNKGNSIILRCGNSFC